MTDARANAWRRPTGKGLPRFARLVEEWVWISGNHDPEAPEFCAAKGGAIFRSMASHCAMSPTLIERRRRLRAIFTRRRAYRRLATASQAAASVSRMICLLCPPLALIRAACTAQPKNSAPFTGRSPKSSCCTLQKSGACRENEGALSSAFSPGARLDNFALQTASLERKLLVSGLEQGRHPVRRDAPPSGAHWR